MKLNIKLYILMLLMIILIPSSVFAIQTEGNCSKYAEYKWYGYSVVIKGEEKIGTVSGNPSISDYFNNKFASGEINAKDVSGIFLFFEDSAGQQYSSKAQTNWKGHIKCSGKVDLIQGAIVEPISGEEESTIHSAIASYKCSDLKRTELYNNILNPAYKFIRIAVPCLLVGLCSYDFITATIADNQENMKKAQKKAIKRIIVGIILFLLPTIMNAFLNLFGEFGTCGVGL